MCLRFSSALIAGTVLAVSSLAHAKTPLTTTAAPATKPALSASQESGLAQVEAILTYCEVVDPLSLARYQQWRKLLTSGNSEIADEQESAAYVSELRTTGGSLAKIPVSAGVSSCRSLIKGM